jgi:hypothetical protein
MHIFSDTAQRASCSGDSATLIHHEASHLTVCSLGQRRPIPMASVMMECSFAEPGIELSASSAQKAAVP